MAPDPETSSSVARAVRLLAAALLVAGTTVALAEQRESLGAAPTRAPPWSALPPAAMYAMYASLALVVAMLVAKAVGNASRLCASSRAAVAAALGVAAAAAAAASLAFGSAGLLPPTLPGALAAVGAARRRRALRDVERRRARAEPVERRPQPEEAEDEERDLPRRARLEVGDLVGGGAHRGAIFAARSERGGDEEET